MYIIMIHSILNQIFIWNWRWCYYSYWL